MKSLLYYLHCVAIYLALLLIGAPIQSVFAADMASASEQSEAAKLLTKDLTFFDAEHQRPVKVKFWYKSNSNGCDASLCLMPNQDKQRVAVLSHGAFGSPQSMNWLGYALASQGWLVAGVAHYQESWAYGTETIDPSVVKRFWQRPQEVSFVIDKLSDDDLFNTSLNTDRVLMLGHSSGGFTTLAMAGAKLEAGKSEAYCASEAAKNDKGCGYGSESPNNIRQASVEMTEEVLNKIGLLQKQMADSRIAAVIALDPALGHASNEESLKAITTPALIIGSVENDFLPFATHAKHYADNIDSAELVGIGQGAGHFIYLDECNKNIVVQGVSICKDREGVNRKAIQRQLLGHVFGFINKNRL